MNPRQKIVLNTFTISDRILWITSDSQIPSARCEVITSYNSLSCKYLRMLQMHCTVTVESISAHWVEFTSQDELSNWGKRYCLVLRLKVSFDMKYLVRRSRYALWVQLSIICTYNVPQKCILKHLRSFRCWNVLQTHTMVWTHVRRWTCLDKWKWVLWDVLVSFDPGWEQHVVHPSGTKWKFTGYTEACLFMGVRELKGGICFFWPHKN